MAVYFDSIQKYFETCTSLKTKIEKIDALILQMLDTAAAGAVSAMYDEYSLDDGQSKIRIKYRDMAALTATIKDLQSLRDTISEILYNNTTGRITRLVDSKNFSR